jgi:uncharacterized protein (TIGR02001 family)
MAASLPNMRPPLRTALGLGGMVRRQLPPDPNKRFSALRLLNSLAMTAGAVAGCVVCHPAAAQGWSGSLGVASDQVLRGISQTGARPVVLASLAYYGAAGFFGSFQGSASEPAASGAATHASASAGWAAPPEGQAWRARVELTRHRYAGAPGDDASGNHELALTLAYREMLFFSLTRTAGSDADAPVGARNTDAAGLAFHWPLPGRWALHGGAGYALVHTGPRLGYGYASASASAQFGPVTIALARFETQSRAARIFGDQAAGRWVFGTVWQF